MSVGSRARRVTRAYKALRSIAREHRELGHDVDFTAINEANICLICHTCQSGPAAEPPDPTVSRRLRAHGREDLADRIDDVELGADRRD